jgi:Bacteroidetes VLRF1 release factor/Ankyrin repeats (many copies)
LTLKPDSERRVTPDVSNNPPPSETAPEPTAQTAPEATTCNLCNLIFPTWQEQRNHFKSDLHHYNQKQRLRGLQAVSEADFDRLIGDLDESISGSESSESDSGDEVHGSKDTTLTALLKKQAKLSQQSEDETTAKQKQGAGKPPMLWFSSSAIPGNTSLGVYRAIFSNSEQDEPRHIVDTIRQKQLSPIHAHSNARSTAEGTNLATKSPHYFLCMIGGGHFAAMIVSLQPKVTKKAGGILERQAVVLAHKTFHRYTTRRKQGGSQSANDASKGAAHSAGSSLRRANEAALTKEVRALLLEWKPMIDTAQLCFIRATGSTNRQALFGPYEGQVLRQIDPRNRGFPFSTRRATQKELMRGFVELTRVKVSTIDEAAQAELAAATDAEKQKEASKSRAPKPQKPMKPTEEEETALLHTQQIQALIRRSKAPALVSYLQSNKISPDFTFYPRNEGQNYHTPTALHLAASLSSPPLVIMLLTKASADPTIKNSEGKTAFDLAGDRATRDSFRIARHTLGETAFAWDAANIPSALTPDEAGKRAAREKAEKAAETAKEAERRKAETERLRREDMEKEDAKREQKFGKGKPLANAEKSAQDQRQEEARGMTPEMRARLERERRARAAEDRIRRMQGGMR